MDVDFNGDVACFDAELLQIPELSPLALKSNPDVARKLFDQWLSLPETSPVVISFSLNEFEQYNCIRCVCVLEPYWAFCSGFNWTLR